MLEDLYGIYMGLEGEKEVDNYLQMYSHSLYNLSGKRICVDGINIENDNILITNRGIFLLEVKNIGQGGNYSIKIGKDGLWSRQKGNKIIPFEHETPVDQNNRHVAYLSKFINKKLLRNLDNSIEVTGIVVISNNILSIDNESMQYIVRPSEIMSIINSYPKSLTNHEMLCIKQEIEKADIGEGKFEMVDYNNVLVNNIEVLRTIVNGLLDDAENVLVSLQALKEEIELGVVRRQG